MRQEITRVPSIHKLHKLLGIEPPAHPLISVIDLTKAHPIQSNFNSKMVFSFYAVMLKQGENCKMKYGRQPFDFEEGTIFYISPDQSLTVPLERIEREHNGWGLYFHPDLLKGSPLNEKIKKYDYFQYNSDESLHISSEEKNHLEMALRNIQKEYNQNLDHFSTELIITNLELFLNYSKRAYSRQFITRKSFNTHVVTDFQEQLDAYFSEEKHLSLGMPTVQYLAEQLNYSAEYLGELMKNETGKGALEYIHEHIVNLAKNLLLNSSDSIGQIAYGLGFEHLSHFAKMFKKNTGMSASEFRSDHLM
ncbi:helix-turn-helix domain-containing protein [Aureibacter tunicatorum]|uniref:AraC-like DNA-binding protein n=1 Tax=Aureibacter tunicatorum TaxID=866807 RepID=A0AAE4BV47_9BACT|nr:helix-turn-helix domain-containing protein [Aureibacter tunicatorum]MDR6241512.1 AraC-like DNA-binding protein [Aureibacter tunicatorum]